MIWCGVRAVVLRQQRQWDERSWRFYWIRARAILPIVLNILARQRDPAPPANILTPDALTLRHAPIADCARYDNLRRTI
jgi:hypothetical protein